jgi:hypothetical protein
MLSVFLIANWRCSSSFLGAVSRLADAFNDRRGFDVIQAKEKAMADVNVVIGPGQIGQAIARRVGVGKHVLLADMRQDNTDAAAEVLANAGYDVSVTMVDASSRHAVHGLVERATNLGDVTGLIHAAGVSPTQASPATCWSRHRLAVRASPSPAHR